MMHDKMKAAMDKMKGPKVVKQRRLSMRAISKANKGNESCRQKGEHQRRRSRFIAGHSPRKCPTTHVPQRNWPWQAEPSCNPFHTGNLETMGKIYRGK